MSVLARLRRREAGFLGIAGITADPAAVARAGAPGGPGQLLVAELGTARVADCALHLAALLDCHSGRSLGSATGHRLRPSLIAVALARARLRAFASPARATRAAGDPAGPERSRPAEIALVLGEGCVRAGVARPAGTVPNRRAARLAAGFFAALNHDFSGRAWSSARLADAVVEWINDY